jgi:hypothetical protein
MHDDQDGRHPGRPRPATCRVEVLDDNDPNLQGGVCAIYEKEGEIVLYNARSHLSTRLATDMTEALATIFSNGPYVQNWKPGTEPRWLRLEDRHRTAAPLPQEHCKIVPAAQLPDDLSCLHVEHEQGQLWLFREGEITPELRDAWNAYLVLLLGDGLWGHQWHGHQNKGDRVHFQVVDPGDPRLNGALCGVKEIPGELHFYWSREHASEALARQLDRQNRHLAETRQWYRHWAPGDTTEQRHTLEGRHWAGSDKAWVSRVPAERLPDGMACMPVELEGALHYLISEQEMSEALAREVNAWLARFIGDGLWRQGWEGPDGPVRG